MADTINRTELSNKYCTDAKTKENCEAFLDQCATQHENICAKSKDPEACQGKGASGKFVLDIEGKKSVDIKSSGMCYQMSPRFAKFYKAPSEKGNQEKTQIVEGTVDQKTTISTKDGKTTIKTTDRKSKKTQSKGITLKKIDSEIEVPIKWTTRMLLKIKSAGGEGRATIKSHRIKEPGGNTTILFEVTVVSDDGLESTFYFGCKGVKPGAKKLSDSQWSAMLKNRSHVDTVEKKNRKKSSSKKVDKKDTRKPEKIKATAKKTKPKKLTLKVVSPRIAIPSRRQKQIIKILEGAGIYGAATIKSYPLTHEGKMSVLFEIKVRDGNVEYDFDLRCKGLKPGKNIPRADWVIMLGQFEDIVNETEEGFEEF
jgi:hypothetical protein